MRVKDSPSKRIYDVLTIYQGENFALKIKVIYLEYVLQVTPLHRPRCR